MSDPSDTGSMSGRQQPSGSAIPAQAREDLRAAAREARMAANDAATSVKQEAVAAAEGLKQEGAALLDTAKERAEGLADETKQAGAERAHGLARAIHRAAEELERDTPQVARLVHDAAGSVDEIARAIRERSPRDMLRSAEDFARRQPFVFMGAAALAGFAVARFARSSAAHRRHALDRDFHDGMHGRAGRRGGEMRTAGAGMGGAGMGGGAGPGSGLSGSPVGGSSAYPRGPATPPDTATGAPGWQAEESGKPKPATMGSASLGGAAAMRPRGGSENG